MVRGQEWTFPAVKGDSHRCTDVLQYLRSECQLQVLRSSSVRLGFGSGQRGGVWEGGSGWGVYMGGLGGFQGFRGAVWSIYGVFWGLIGSIYGVYRGL